MNPRSLPPACPEEQLVYARWLDLGTRAGLLLLLASFVLYMLGVFPPHIPLDDLPRFWRLPVDQYLSQAALPSGWGWVTHLRKGDMLNFAGIAALALVTPLCFLRLLAEYLRRGDRMFAALVAVEICVLVLAAAGLASH